MSADPSAPGDRRALMLRLVEWLVERHHQSLGLWPWTWTGREGEPYVTLYAACVAVRFGHDFGALANWIEASRWPSVDETPHPATFFRDRIGCPVWALTSPLAAETAHPRAMALDVEQLARGGASVETLAQLLEAASRLDQYLALLAPQRHGGHPHREAAGAMAVLVLRLATAAALALGVDYTIPWSGPAGGQANGISDPDWDAFQTRYRLARLPFAPDAPAVFTLGERGWLHAGGWLGDWRGTVLRLGAGAVESAAFPAVRAQTLALLAA
ncbi:MAG: hypothetical protein IT340_20615 [Chloroflexi bacterium]|nr:hypothetical protein [Chloroflexota bacterium]